MKSINNILNKGERAVAVFTTHDEWSSNLKFNPDGTGYTGDWVLRKDPNVEVVFIYHRVESGNRIHKAKITSIEGPLAKHKRKRYRIHFCDSKYLGNTDETWSDFADCGANPVKYFS